MRHSHSLAPATTTLRICLIWLCLQALPGHGRGASTDLNPYPVPAWVEECTRPAFTDRFNEAALDAAAKAGVQAIFNVGIYLTYFDGEGFYTAEPGADKRLVLKAVDATEIRKFKDQVDAIHRRGIKAIGTMPPMWEIKVLNEHPDWQVLHSPDEKPRDAMAGWPPPSGSFISPFGDFYIRKNIKMVSTWNWDGQNIDGFGFQTLDFNPYNAKAYREASGAEIPKKEDPDDPNYRHYLRWRMQQWDKFVYKWETALKQLKPDFAFTPWSTGPGRWWHWSALPRIEGTETGNLFVDAPVLELFWDFPPNQGMNLLPSFTIRFYRGFCEERPVWMHSYFRSQGQQWAITPRVESEFRLLCTLANGAVAPCAAWMQTTEAPFSHYLEMLKAREPWLIRTRSEKWAAMLVSENSRIFYGIPGTRSEFGMSLGSGVDTRDYSKLPPSQRRLAAHIESALGLFRAASEAHLPLDIISDRILDRGDWRQAYKVLCLPNAACLSERGLEQVRHFVQDGGGLVASQETSLYTEDGDRRADFGLADLFNAKFVGVVDHTATWPDYEHTALLEFEPHAITRDKVVDGNTPLPMDSPGPRMVDYIGKAAEVKVTGTAQVIARRFPASDRSEAAKKPFLLVSEAGKGRVAYFAAAPDQAYFVAPYQYERALIVNALRWVAGESKPRVEVQAPMAVLATFYQQNQGQRLIVHLLNELNSTADRAMPANNPPMREEIIPIRNLRVKFRDKAVRRVTLQPEGLALPIEMVEDGVEVTVPQLDLHTMVVAEKP